MKVLVTGAAGFIGSHVVDALVSRGAEVVGIDSLDREIYHGPPDYLNPSVDYCFADLRLWEPDARVEGTAAVIHLAALGGVARAAREPTNLVDANVNGTARLLEGIGQIPTIRKFVLASSFSVYGANYRYQCVDCGSERDGQRQERDLQAGIFEVLCTACGGDTHVRPLPATATPDPLELYGASKYMQELCVRGPKNYDVHILRQSSVYGPRLRLDDGEATIVARMAGWIRDGRRPQLFEDGKQIRDWVHVDDSVAAMLASLENPTTSPIVNVCTGVPTRLDEACIAIAGAMGTAVEPEVVGGYRAGDMRHCLGDASGLEALIGRRPTEFSLGAKLTFASSAGSEAS